MKTNKRLILGVIGAATAGAGALAYGAKKALSSDRAIATRERLMKKGKSIIGDLTTSFDNLVDGIAEKLGRQKPQLEMASAGGDVKYRNAFLSTADKPTFHDTMTHAHDSQQGFHTLNHVAGKPIKRYNRNR